MSFFEANDHPNAHNSTSLALANIFLFITGRFLPLIFNSKIYSIDFFIVELVLGIGTFFSAKIGIKNTYETNDDWKSGVQVASTIADIIIPALFISSNL